MENKHWCPVCRYIGAKRISAGFNGPLPWELYECQKCYCEYEIIYGSPTDGEKKIVKTERWETREINEAPLAEGANIANLYEALEEEGRRAGYTE